MRALAKATVGIGAILLLAGCTSPFGTGTGMGGTGATDGVAGGRQQVSCSAAAGLTLDGRDIRYDVVGDCGDVTVRGQDLDVRMASSTSLLVEGQDNDIESTGGLGAVQVRGDDNDVEARTIASITVAGDDNAFEADTVGSVEVSGNDNGVEAGNDPQPVRISGDGNTVERR